MSKTKSILDLSNIEAKDFFLREKSYCSIDLPLYFKFEPLLKKLSQQISDTELKTLSKEGKTKAIKILNDVNYKLTTNKDGKLSWREFQIINPVVYIVLCNLITDEKNWNIIKTRFKKFRKYNKYIDATAIPVVPNTNKKQVAAQVSEWWGKNEQKAIDLALDYEFVAHTDIATFYDSIYTHSISWALHGKSISKNRLGKQEEKNLGEKLDEIFQAMSFAETHGIPQGSVICDFIAEMLLGYTDVFLYYSLRKKRIDYKILRYRDDYRIFTHSSSDAEIILCELSKILQQTGLRLNSKKTFISDDVITASIKPDKLENLLHISFEKNSLEKQLIYIYKESLKYPNAGTIIKYLKRIYDNIDAMSKFDGKENVLLSLLSNIAFKNPKTYPSIVAISSKILEKKDVILKKEFACRLLKRLSNIPYIAWLEIWLQRIFIDTPEITKSILSTSLTQCVRNESIQIWNMDWIQDARKPAIEDLNFIDKDELKKLSPVVAPYEFDLFTENSTLDSY